VTTEPTATQQQDVAAIQQAIADGQDPTQTLEAPAGPQAGALAAVTLAVAAADRTRMWSSI
jgi:hypothetical protein